MRIGEYLLFVSQKLEEVENKGDKEEWIRIAKVLVETLKEKIVELGGLNEER